MGLGEALRDGDDLAEKLRRFETSQLQMGLHLLDYARKAKVELTSLGEYERQRAKFTGSWVETLALVVAK